jgi:type IV pilus assembly protein PilY1
MRRSLLFTVWLILAAIAPALADDLSVYGGIAVDVPPNVMIILDNSGSMDTVDVPGAPYEKGTTYSGSYSTNKVYRCKSSGCSEFAPSIAAISCNKIKNDLTDQHYASGRIKTSSPYGCGGGKDSNLSLRTGNYANYVAAGLGTKRRRLDVAKEAVTELINNTPDVRFGLFKFNDSQGGSLVAECGASKTTLLNAVKNWKAETWTPLAETLAETGLYFAGRESWFNKKVTYTSPIQYRCQNNYIVLVTDGEPTQDDDKLLTKGAYINGDIIGDRDGDGKDPGKYDSNGSDYLDDVAHYLFNEDCGPKGMGKDPADGDDRFEKQAIRTYTIGFLTEQQLLEDTGDNGGGLADGSSQYFTANNADTLNEAFKSIFNTIDESNVVFVAPVVPVSQLNRAFAGNKIYLAFFRPEKSGRWSGNLKSYNLTDDGQLLDINGNPAVGSDGLLLDAQSRWSPNPDGPDVKAGGVGELLVGTAATRKIYTYLGASSQLSAAGNAFTTGNAALTNALLGVSSAAERTSVINAVRGEGSSWPLGDIVHSEPVVVHYGSGSSISSYIFVGANDGMLHAIDDATGKEVWGFVPPGQLSQVRNLTGSAHSFYVDGSPTYFETGGKKVLIFGERRGGNRLYALDITTPLDPRWLYELNAQKLSASGAKALLGQSWSRPLPVVVKSGGIKTSAFLLAGGYDPRQDSTPSGDDTMGRAIYAVNTLTGALTSVNFNGGNWAEMKNSLLDVGGYDGNDDGAIDLIYGGDLGGKIFALRDPNASGTWQKRVLFQVPDSLNGKTMGKKFMYAPAVTKASFGEYVYAGTGDRENPADKTLTNAIYALKSNWTPAGSGGALTTLTPADLVDVSTNAIQAKDPAVKKAAADALKAGKGWYFTLNAGEKIVASPVVFDGVVFFTTYTPAVGGVSSSDPCGPDSNRGTGRLYAVDYKTGGAAYRFTSDKKRLGPDDEASKDDRWKPIVTDDPGPESPIPPAPAIEVGKDDSRVRVGVETLPVDDTKQFHRYFWQQVQ